MTTHLDELSLQLVRDVYNVIPVPVRNVLIIFGVFLIVSICIYIAFTIVYP